VEWERVVAAANVEGKVVVNIPPGDQFRRIVGPFSQAYPHIELEAVGLGGRSFSTRVIPERQAGKYLWDVFIDGPTTALKRLHPVGALDPLPSALILPIVLDDKNWLGGFAAGWVDETQSLAYQFEINLASPAQVNRDVIPVSELGAVADLIDPKWKSKIIMEDPRVPGGGQGDATHFVLTLGEDWYRTLLTEQDIQISQDGRAIADAMVRGDKLILIGGSSALQEFQKEGIGTFVKPLVAPPDAKTDADVRLRGGWGHMALMNQAPHPNAAKVFINWMLGPAGAQAWVDEQDGTVGSRRTDVNNPVDLTMPAEVVPKNIDLQKYAPYKDKAIEISIEVLGR
jgi:iron(III) transport system substrate-binding protein